MERPRVASVTIISFGKEGGGLHLPQVLGYKAESDKLLMPCYANGESGLGPLYLFLCVKCLMRKENQNQKTKSTEKIRS